MRWGVATDTGRVRQRNEDYVIVRPEAGFFAVADGMGGHRAGEVASRLALESLDNYLCSFLEGSVDIESVLRQGVHEANRSVYETSLKNPGFRGMGTTLSCVVIKKNDLFLAHVGDSRIYLWREGDLARLTEDHSVVQEMIKKGRLTEGQAKEHPYRHVLTRALGTSPLVKIDTARISLCARDVILICTDGLSGLVEDAELNGIISCSPGPEQAVRKMVELALGRGGTDNISVVVVVVD
ncbi:MAG: Stp1/IreP family PP2C-type Ser/Thr phosphatase [Desulfotomaculales bacterium]